MTRWRKAVERLLERARGGGVSSVLSTALSLAFAVFLLWQVFAELASRPARGSVALLVPEELVEELLAEEEPSADEESSAEEEPSADQESSADGDPSETQESSADKEPVPVKLTRVVLPPPPAPPPAAPAPVPLPRPEARSPAPEPPVPSAKPLDPTLQSEPARPIELAALVPEPEPPVREPAPPIELAALVPEPEPPVREPAPPIELAALVPEPEPPVSEPAPARALVPRAALVPEPMAVESVPEPIREPLSFRALEPESPKPVDPGPDPSIEAEPEPPVSPTLSAGTEPEPRPEAPPEPGPSPKRDVAIRVDDVAASEASEGRILLRTLEHGSGPSIEISWPASARDRGSLYGLMTTCFGVETALLDANGRLYNARNDGVWQPNTDRYSGFMREAVGSLPSGESEQVRIIRRRHAGLGRETVVRLFPRRVDAVLLGGLHRIVGDRYASAGSIRATYSQEGQTVLVNRVRVDGRPLDGRIRLEPPLRCRV